MAGDVQGSRVLVWGLTNNLAGTEAVIANYVHVLEGTDIAFDFLVMEDVPNYSDITSCPNRVFVVPNKRTDMRAYYAALNDLFRKHAQEWSAVWSNLNILNNIDVLRLGAKHGIPRRILHAHNAGNDGKLHQRVLCALHKPMVPRFVTDRWACSKEAGSYLFPGEAYTVLPNAVDVGRCAFNPDARSRVRAELGLAPDDHVIGAVGRFVEQKNIGFLLLRLPELLAQQPRARILLVGGGELEGELRKLCHEIGILDYVTFAGIRRDIPDVLSAIDVYAMPSLFEGLPLSLLEAQFNGLPCVVSDSVSREACISTGCAFVSLKDETAWTQALLGMSREATSLDSRATRFDLAAQASVIKDVFAPDASGGAS